MEKIALIASLEVYWILQVAAGDLQAKFCWFATLFIILPDLLLLHM